MGRRRAQVLGRWIRGRCSERVLANVYTYNREGNMIEDVYYVTNTGF